MTVALDPSDTGTDITLVSDLSPVWGLSSGNVKIANAIARRLSCDRGGLFYDPTYGYNVLVLLNASLTPAQISTARGSIAAECQKEPEVQSATVKLTFTQSKLTIAISLLGANGPFDLILLASGVTVDVLSIDGVTLATVALPTSSTAALSGGGVGPQGPPGVGVPGPAGPAGTPSITLDAPGIVAVNVTSEQVCYQFDAVDFGALAGGSLTAEFTASVLSQVGTSLFKLRIGGTDGVADGTVLATISCSSVSYVVSNATGTFTNPTGHTFVKITAASGSAGNDARIKGLTVTFR